MQEEHKGFARQTLQDRSPAMPVAQPTPEQLIADMSNAQLRELLADLQIASTPSNAKRLRHLTGLLADFEAAVDVMTGPAPMRRAA